MAIIRIQKTDNYTVMSNHHLRNKDMSLKAKGLMSLMLSLPPQWDYSIGGLAAICKESTTAIRSAVKELEDNHYLIRERKNNEKGYFVYEYNLYEVPQPHTGNQHTVKVEADNTHIENGRQISKEEVSKDKLNIDKVNKEKEKEEIELSLLELGDIELIELYRDYIDMRISIDAPLTPRGLKMLINRAKRLSQGNVRVEKVLVENAVINSWKNIFPPKESELKHINADVQRDLKEMFGL